MVWRCLLLLHQLVNNEQYSIIQLTGVTRMNIELAIILLVKTLYKLRYRVVPMKTFSFKDKNFQNMVHDMYTLQDTLLIRVTHHRGFWYDSTAPVGGPHVPVYTNLQHHQSPVQNIPWLGALVLSSGTYLHNIMLKTLLLIFTGSTLFFS